MSKNKHKDNHNRNAHELLRKGQLGPNGSLANSITVEVRVKGQLVNQSDLPHPDPMSAGHFAQQALNAMMQAVQVYPKKRLVMGVMPNWKIWVMRKILRAF